MPHNCLSEAKALVELDARSSAAYRDCDMMEDGHGDYFCLLF